MENLTLNLENVLTKAEEEVENSRSLKTLMNTYRTILNRTRSLDISEEVLLRLKEHKGRLKSLLVIAEDKINKNLTKKDYKTTDNYAEVTSRISKALLDIQYTLEHYNKNIFVDPGRDYTVYSLTNFDGKRTQYKKKISGDFSNQAEVICKQIQEGNIKKLKINKNGIGLGLYDQILKKSSQYSFKLDENDNIYKIN